MAQNNRKIIISCAITGSVHTPTMSEYLPITASQIVESAVEAAETGAAIVHLHARMQVGQATARSSSAQRLHLTKPKSPHITAPPSS